MREPASPDRKLSSAAPRAAEPSRTTSTSCNDCSSRARTTPSSSSIATGVVLTRIRRGAHQRVFPRTRSSATCLRPLSRGADCQGFPQYELREAVRLGHFEDEGWRVRKDGTPFWAHRDHRRRSGTARAAARLLRDHTATSRERRDARGALRAERQRFRSLVESVARLRHLHARPDGHIASWNAGRASASRATRADEIIGQHFSIFYPPEAHRRGLARQYELGVAAARRAASRTRAGACARTARASGPTSSSPRCATTDGQLRRLRQGHARPHRAARSARRRCARARSASACCRGRPGLRHLHARPRRPRRELERGRRAHQGLHAPTRSSASTSRSSTRRKTSRPASPAQELEIAERDGHVEEEGWRVRKDGTRSGRTWSSPRCATRRRADRLRRRSRATSPSGAPPGARFEDARRVAAEEAARRAAEDREGAPRAGDAAAAAGERARASSDEAEEARTGRRGQSRQERVPRGDVARAAHAAQRDRRLRGAAGDGLGGPVTTQQTEHLERIQRSQQHLLGIINDILNFSRIEAGQLTYELATRAHAPGDRVPSLRDDRAAGGREGLTLRRRPTARKSVAAIRGPREARADPAQPAVERGQVHARRAARST